MDENIDSKKDFIKFRHKIIPKIKKKKLKKDYSGDSNSIFIGEYGYPDVNVGVLSAEYYNHNDDVNYWIKNKLKISDIASARMDLINSRKKRKVKAKDIGSEQEIALAKKPANIEVNLKDVPKNNMNFSKHHLPSGPSGEMEKFRLTSNPKIPLKVEKIISDTDLNSTKGLNILYDKGFREDYLTQALSSGSLGLKDNRKMVPTKWSITAVDDNVSKNIIKKIKDYKTTGNIAFKGSYLGNYFLILVFDGIFSYELFEFFRNKDSYTTDYESHNGRKKYAFETEGGYYASRISIAKKFEDMKKQGQCLVLRYITDEYYIPLGVWVVREAVKKTMENHPIEFGSEDLMINFAKVFSKKKFNRDISKVLERSLLLKSKKQKKVEDYF
ncbi:MAG: hypothetical protein ACQER9_02385 [Nanobdellota archaeon]